MAKPKLHQHNAAMQGFKAEAQRSRDRAYHAAQRAALFSGLSRTYEPLAEDGEQFPPESTKVQMLAEDLIKAQREAFSALLDAELTQDDSNSRARADVTLPDGTVLIPDCPVTFLLRAERQVQDILTVVDKLPVVDPSEDWEWDEGKDCYATQPVKTRREEKVLKALVLHPGTDKHPPQTQAYNDTVAVGHWNLVKLSGAMLPRRKEQLRQRLITLQAAIRSARERANTAEVTERKCGDPVFDYLLAP